MPRARKSSCCQPCSSTSLTTWPSADSSRKSRASTRRAARRSRQAGRCTSRRPPAGWSTACRRSEPASVRARVARLDEFQVEHAELLVQVADRDVVLLALLELIQRLLHVVDVDA